MNAPRPQEDTMAFRKMLTLIVTLVILYALLTCFYQVRVCQAAVLTTFEKPTAAITTPGLRVKWPWPIQNVYVFDTRSRVYQSPLREYQVKDGFNVVTRVFACWAIADAERYKNKIGVTLPEGEKIIADLVERSVANTLSQSPFSALIGAPRGADGGLAAVEREILGAVAKEASAVYGMRAIAFGFDRLELPSETTNDVFERMKSERLKRVEKIISEGKNEADQIRNDAETLKKRVIAEAEAEAIRIRGEAETQAFAYLDVYNQRPAFALFLKKLRALENVVKNKTTLVIDRDAPPFDMLSPDALKTLNADTQKVKTP